VIAILIRVHLCSSVVNSGSVVYLCCGEAAQNNPWFLMYVVFAQKIYSRANRSAPASVGAMISYRKLFSFICGLVALTAPLAMLAQPAAAAQSGLFDSHVHLWKGEGSLQAYEEQL
jgi:hypothetical protein